MAFRRFVCGTALLTAALGCGGPSGDMSAEGSAPLFEVDPLWPKPLPNHWLLGSTIGVAGTLAGVGLGLAFALNIETIRGGLESITGTNLFAEEIWPLSGLVTC